MKKIAIICVLCAIFFLSGCYLFANDESKFYENPNYIEDYMTELGLVDIEEIYVFAETEVMNLAYDMAGVNETCHSDYIYFYRGTDSDGEKFDVLIPERARETNLGFKDYLLSFEELADIIQPYNNSTTSVASSYFSEDEIYINDILLRGDEFRVETIDYLWSDVNAGGTEIDVDEDATRELLMEKLSSPIIYRIGRYLKGDTSRYGTIYLGLGDDLEYVFILEYNNNTSIEIIYSILL